MPFWETVLDFSGVAAGIAAVLHILTDVSKLFGSDSLKARIKWACVFMFVAAVAGQMTGGKMLAATANEIVAFLNDRAQTANHMAGEANKLAGEAIERAGLANARAGEADERAGKAHERAAALELAAEELRTENFALEAKLRGIGIQIGDRSINDKERSLLGRGLKDTKYDITVVMIDDREARQYALAMADALQKSTVRVRKEQIATTSETGVIVCGRGKKEIALVKILRGAAIKARLANKKDRPEVCDRAVTTGPQLSPLTWFADANANRSAPRGTVILVGQKEAMRLY